MFEPGEMLSKAFLWITGRGDERRASTPDRRIRGGTGRGIGNGAGNKTGAAGVAGRSSIPGHLLLGAAGEEAVAAKAEILGWNILARNWRPEQEDVRRFGRVEPRCRGLELDLVALDSGTLVFVEVRTKTINASSVDAAQYADLLAPSRLFGKGKRERFLRAARCWLLYKDMWHYPCRFDLFCVGRASCAADGGALAASNFSLEHYSNVLEDCHAVDSRNATWQPW